MSEADPGVEYVAKTNICGVIEGQPRIGPIQKQFIPDSKQPVPECLHSQFPKENRQDDGQSQVHQLRERQGWHGFLPAFYSRSAGFVLPSAVRWLELRPVSMRFSSSRRSAASV